MNLKEYIVKNDEKVLSYIDGHSLDDVILKDYYYFSPTFIKSTEPLYTDNQIARILNITDKEYAGFVLDYLSKDGTTNDNSSEIETTQKKIDELNEKLNKSKSFDEATKKLVEIDKEIEKVDKDLSSINDIDQKSQDIQNDLNLYSELSRFNLPKIHQDLVSINSQIDKLEEELLNKKVVDIKESNETHHSNSARSGLGIGVLFASGIFGLIAYLVQSKSIIHFIIWGVGIGVALLLIFTSKEKGIRETNHNFTDPNIHSYEDIENLIHRLKTQRNGILKLLNLKNTGEFFIMKAKYASAKKSHEYIQSQRTEIAERLKLDELNEKKNELVKQKAELEEKVQDPAVVLKPEETLNIYREIDTLKMGLNQVSAMKKVDKEKIPERLEEIRKELKDKLPFYVDTLKNTFQKSYESIKSTIKKACADIGLVEFEIDPELSDWDKLNFFQKFLVQYALANGIYNTNYSFILEEVSKWSSEERTQLKAMLDKSESEVDLDIVILDEVKNY
jgi:hypothetical protein